MISTEDRGLENGKIAMGWMVRKRVKKKKEGKNVLFKLLRNWTQVSASLIICSALAYPIPRLRRHIKLSGS